MRITEPARRIAFLGMFTAVIFLLAFTPIGFIQLPFIKATIVHVPVIIGGIILGVRHGAALGFMFGVTSLINNSLMPAVSSFAFSPLIPLPGAEHGSALALAVCFVPRILVGVVPRLVYVGLNKAMGNRGRAAVYFTAGVMGSLTNTLLVMHMIFFFFKDAYADASDVTPEIVYNIILGIIAANGIPEAITAGVIVTVVCAAIIRSKIKILRQN